MPGVIRHDGITLGSGVKEDDFERFMKEELIPYFSERYRGPTRSSKADIKSQSLLRDSKSGRKWLWVTGWSGSPEDVRGPFFANARMVRMEETEAMLEKLAAFGKRSAAKVFSEVDSARVATNR